MNKRSLFSCQLVLVCSLLWSEYSQARSGTWVCGDNPVIIDDMGSMVKLVVHHRHSMCREVPVAAWKSNDPIQFHIDDQGTRSTADDTLNKCVPYSGYPGDPEDLVKYGDIFTVQTEGGRQTQGLDDSQRRYYPVTVNFAEITVSPDNEMWLSQEMSWPVVIEEWDSCDGYSSSYPVELVLADAMTDADGNRRFIPALMYEPK